MIKMQEVFERVVIDSGQFLLNSDELELKRDQFAILCRSVLSTYSRYVPVPHLFTLDCTAVRNHTFTKETTKWEEFPEGKVPDNVNDVIPTGGSFVFPMFFMQYFQLGGLTQSSQAQSSIRNTQPYPWTYRKPTLTIAMNARIDVYTIIKQQVREVITDGNTEYFLDGINGDDGLFFDLMTARFLKAIGRQRRSFTLQDVSLIVDAPQLVAEGDALEKETIKNLEDNNNWFLAWG